MTAHLPNGLLGLVLLAPLAAATTPEAQPAQNKLKEQPKDSDITGFYYFEGKDGGKTYYGIVSVEKVRDTYAVHWMMPGSQYIGAGIRQGNQFTVGWRTETKAGPIVGVHSMTIGKDGSLSGVWTSLPGAGRPQPETWEFLRKMPGKDAEISGTTPQE